MMRVKCIDALDCGSFIEGEDDDGNASCDESNASKTNVFFWFPRDFLSAWLGFVLLGGATVGPIYEPVYVGWTCVLG